MSQIFDALQRSESERSGTDPAKLATAADLVEIAERRLVDFATDGDRVIDKEQQTQVEHRAQNRRTDQLSQFERVRVIVPPQSKLVCITEEESLAAEKFRYLGVKLRHLQQKHPIKKLLITSSSPEEGKSTVAANLARTLAQRHPQKTLLLEGDLRRPTLAQQFGLGKIRGLTEMLQGESASPMNVYEVEGQGFWILPAGNPLRNPPEFLQSEKLSVLMDQLSGWFDWIVIDSPPVLPLADTSVWVRLADAVLLVTRPGKTEKQQLQRALEAVDKSKLLGALVNGSKESTKSGYYHYYAAKRSGLKATGQLAE